MADDMEKKGQQQDNQFGQGQQGGQSGQHGQGQQSGQTGQNPQKKGGQTDDEEERDRQRRAS
jgi:hypothetical protein